MRREARVRARVEGWVELGMWAAAAVALFCAFDALPFMDLPGHAAVVAIRARLAHSPWEQALYVAAPHLDGPWLFHGAAMLLSTLVGPMAALRVLAAASVLAVPASILYARSRLYGKVSPGFGHVGLVLALGLMTLFGFVTFMLGVAALVVCMALWVDLLTRVAAAGERRRLAPSALVLAACSIVLLWVHGFAFMIFLAAAAASGLAVLLVMQRTRAPLAPLLAPALAPVPALLLAALAVWQEHLEPFPEGSVPPSYPRSGMYFQPALDKLSILFTPTLMTRTGIDVAVDLGVWCIAVASVRAALEWQRQASPADEPAVQRSRLAALAFVAAAAVLFAGYVVAPHEIGWFGFVDGRLLLGALVLAVVGVPPPAVGPRLARAYERGAPVLAGITAGLALFAGYRFQSEARGYRETLARVPASARLLSLPVDPNSAVFTGHPFAHYADLATVDRPVLVSDIWFLNASGLYPRPGNPILRLPHGYASSNMPPLDWSRYDLGSWDYVLVRTKPEAPAPATPAALRLDAHVGGWWLFTPAGR